MTAEVSIDSLTFGDNVRHGSFGNQSTEIKQTFRSIYAVPDQDTVLIGAQKGKIWAATGPDDFLLRYADFPDTTRNIRDITKDWEGRIWVATSAGAWYRSESGWVQLGQTSDYNDSTIDMIEIMPDSSVWMAKREGSLTYWKNGVFTKMPVSSIRSMQAVPHAGKVYFGSYGNVRIVDAATLGVSELAHDPVQMPELWAAGGWQDADGNQYVGLSHYIGIYDGTWHGFEVDTNNGQYFRFIQDNDNILWACGDQRVAHYSDTLPSLLTPVLRPAASHPRTDYTMDISAQSVNLRFPSGGLWQVRLVTTDGRVLAKSSGNSVSVTLERPYSPSLLVIQYQGQTSTRWIGLR